MKWLSAWFGLGSQRRRNELGEEDGDGKEEEEGLNRNRETGLEMEESSVVWRIKNFPVIQKNDTLVNLQTLEFSAGATIGQPSRWTVYLKAEKEKKGKKWIGIYFRVIEPSPLSPDTPGLHLYSQMSFAIKDTAGATTWTGITRMVDFSKFNDGLGWGFNKMIVVDGSVPPVTLEIHLTLNLYSPVTKPQATVPSTLLKFHERSAAKARKDFGGLIQNPVPGGDVKIISGDGKEFSVNVGILAARSPVFAMLRSNMTEAKSGRIDLPDISGKGLKVLLNFIYTGELPAGWKDGGVIVELTNAAAKYQFSDLLEFLDTTLGKVCDVKNVGPLLALASQLSLKIAQEELLKFVKEKGASSVDNFSQIMKVISVTAVESTKS